MKTTIRIASLVFVFILIATFSTSYAAMDMMDTIEMKELSDVKDHWGKTFIEELVSKDIVSGYPDQTFRPDNTITRAEFIVMLLKAKKISPMEGMAGHWANGWKDAAIEAKYLMSGEFTDLDKAITRGEIALMVDRALASRGHYYMARTMDVVDTKNLSEDQKMAVLNVFDAGIVSGYSDNTFRVDNPATRAEAATMTVRVISPEKRASKDLVFDKETLAKFNGKNGMRSLVAVDGKVYDVSDVGVWANGTHFNGAVAGVDISQQIREGSPHGLSTLSLAKEVGIYQE